MVLNTLQNLGLWAKSKKKIFFDLPLVVRQMLGFALKLFWKKLFCTNQIDFPKINYKNLKYFNLVHVHKPKLGPAAIKCWMLIMGKA